MLINSKRGRKRFTTVAQPFDTPLVVEQATNKVVRRFALKVALLLSPFLAALALPLFVLLTSGELTPIESVVSAQRSNSNVVLYGAAFSDLNQRYKLLGTLEHQPAVLALGTSRVMQFRSELFRDPAQFYNAGGGVWLIEDFNDFLSRIPSAKQPQVIIMGLDQNFFNLLWSRNKLRPSTSGYDAPASNNVLGIIKSSWLRTYGDFVRGRYSFGDLAGNLIDQRVIGLNALALHTGFRNDGSYYYGVEIEQPNNPASEDYNFKSTLSQIANGQGRLEYGSSLSATSLAELTKFLATCKERGITVIGFLPPYPHQVYAQIASMPDYSYMRLLVPTISPIFQNYGFDFYDYSDLATLDAPDTEAINGMHGSENAYLRAFVKMAANDDILREYAADPAYLEQKLHETTSPLQVFDKQTGR